MKASKNKLDFKLKQVLENFTADIASIDDEFKFNNKRTGAFIRAIDGDTSKVGDKYSSEIFIKKGFFSRKKIILLINYYWTEKFGLRLDINFYSNESYKKIKFKVSEYLKKYSKVLKNVEINQNKHF